MSVAERLWPAQGQVRAQLPAWPWVSLRSWGRGWVVLTAMTFGGGQVWGQVLLTQGNVIDFLGPGHLCF